MKKSAHRNQILKYAILKRAAQGAMALSFAALLAVVAFVLARGLPHINFQLLFGGYSGKSPSIKPAAFGTLCLVLVSISISAPIGIGSAIFLAEYTKSGSRFVKISRLATETLAGIPSIVYGIFGYLVFVAGLGFKYSLIGGGITLSIMILPVIVRSTEECLLAVPRSLREGSFALGSSKTRTIFSVVLPCAASGIATSVILAVGRVISESAALMLTVGMVVDKMPQSLASPGTSLALDVYYFGSFGYPEQAAAASAALLILVAAINISAALLCKIFGNGQGYGQQI